MLYLSHGTSGDIYGDELRWMNEGAVANILDNLIAEGKTEDVYKRQLHGSVITAAMPDVMCSLETFVTDRTPWQGSLFSCRSIRTKGGRKTI